MYKPFLFLCLMVFSILSVKCQYIDSINFNIVVKGNFTKKEKYHLIFRTAIWSDTFKGIAFGSEKGYFYYCFNITDTTLFSKNKQYYSLDLYKEGSFYRLLDIGSVRIPGDTAKNILLLNKTIDIHAQLYPFEIKWIDHKEYINMLITDMNSIKSINFKSR